MKDDFIDVIYQKIKEDQIITDIVEERIRFYTYENFQEETKPFLIIRPLNADKGIQYGNDLPIQYEQDFQIDIQSKNRKDCRIVMSEIEKIMREINCRELTYNSLDEWFAPVGRYALAKRFRIKSNFKGEEN